MAWELLPLPRLIYPSADAAELPQGVGGRMVDMFVDTLGNYRSRPKLSEFTDLGTEVAVDGLYWSENYEFVLAVSGGNVYKVSQNGLFSDITGDKLTAGVRPMFDTDGETIVMASGARMVTYNNAGTTAFMADADAPVNVTHPAFLDGYMLANKVDTKRWHRSSPTNILSYATLDFDTAEAKPDNLEALFVQEREITLFGRQSIEYWFNDGTPFSRIETALNDFGVGAIYSIEPTKDGRWLLLTDKRRVRLIKGRQSQDVSGPVDSIIKDLDLPRNGRSFFVQMREQSFYVLTFPDDNKTLALDLTTGIWAEWGQWNAADGAYDMFRGISYAFADRWDFHLIGDKNNGKIYKLSFDNNDDDGNEVRSMLRTSPIDYGTGNYKENRGLRIYGKRGLGTGFTEPMLGLRWRDDGGQWSNEIQVSLGKIGDNEYYHQLPPLGTYRTREWEIIHTYDTDLSIKKIEEDVKVMRH